MGELLNINRDIVDAAEAAYQRTKPLIEKVSENTRELAFTIRAEWQNLNEEDRHRYANKLGWSYAKVMHVAAIKKQEYLEKEKLIRESLDPTVASIDLESLSLTHMQEINRTSKSLLKKAVKEGHFDEGAPSTQTIRQLRKTGSAKKVPTKKKSELQKVKEKITDATKAVKKANTKIAHVHRWLEENDVEEIKGPQIVSFWAALGDLNAQVASLDPEKAEKAGKILLEGWYE